MVRIQVQEIKKRSVLPTEVFYANKITKICISAVIQMFTVESALAVTVGTMRNLRLKRIYGLGGVGQKNIFFPTFIAFFAVSRQYKKIGEKTFSDQKKLRCLLRSPPGFSDAERNRRRIGEAFLGKHIHLLSLSTYVIAIFFPNYG